MGRKNWRIVISMLLFWPIMVFSSKPAFIVSAVTPVPPIVYKGQILTLIYRVTNNSPQQLNRNGLSQAPLGLTQVNMSNGCSNPFNLAVGESCLLYLQVDTNVMQSNVMQGGPTVCYTADNPVYCAQPSPNERINITVIPSSATEATIQVSGSPLVLTASSTQSGVLTVVNTSPVLTAANVKATLPAGWTDVTQDASDCQTILPGRSCQLRFTAGNTSYGAATATVAGTNTTAVQVTISVAYIPAPIQVSGSPLVLIASSPQPGVLTVSNTSSVVTATNVKATLPAGWSDVTQDASACQTILPGGSCQLRFTAGNTPHSAATATVAGTNTTAVQVTISVIYIPATLALNTSTVVMQRSGSSRSLTVFNTSPTVTALLIEATLPSSWADVTQDASNCQSVPPSGSCELIFTPGSEAHPPTSISISGTNTSTVNATFSVILPYVTNGQVNSIVSDLTNNIIYLGGTFSTLGVVSGSGLFFDSASSTPSPNYPIVNNTIRAVVSDGNGGWYIGGNFTNIGTNIAHINADGSVDTTFTTQTNDIVYALVYNSGTLYLGGAFTEVNGQIRNYIAAVSGVTGQLTTWNPNANNTVYSLLYNASIVYAGGAFTSIGGQARNRIAALNTAGTATAWNPNANNTVYGLLLNGGLIMAGGDFTTIGALARPYLVSIDMTTGLANAFSPNLNASAYTMLLEPVANLIYVGGAFTTAQGVTRNHLAAYNQGGALTTWNPNANGTQVNALDVVGGVIYAAGDFTTIGGQARTAIAGINPTTSAPTLWNPAVNPGISAATVGYALAHFNSQIYAGGNFTSSSVQTRNNIAAINGATGGVTSWNPNANNAVRALLLNGSTLYVGGDFTTIGGQTRSRIAAVSTSTGSPLTWNPNANNSVYTFGLNNNALYTGGNFTSIAGQTRNYLAALDIGTGNALPWNPNANGAVNTLAISGSIIYTGGLFTTINGIARNYIAAIDADSGIANSWNPNADNGVNAIAINNGIAYIGGYFTTVASQVRNFIAAIDANTGVASSWDPNANNGVLALVVSNNIVYAGGAFTQMNSQPKGYVAAINASTGAVINTTPDANNNVLALSLYNDLVYLGGSFTNLSADVSPYIGTMKAVTN